ncbi:peptide ABC transporter substrate-binding protein [Thermoflavimicrobium dichotomicum]|uniref:Oligopeptide transport system substrate-binding protein n=1 Tax=Thermoflavimicrobium dichotomicum TaxID=46223 RepID=A0A1I3TT13_9BACL|nr:peptide ABC transporter substrate-binding protein [Thermoflavimicrobium dichotomicum]SFJ73760.1 oligopeptide transport system substrate-binding protein [Thermoflavimicrobium dichotomicum]
MARRSRKWVSLIILLCICLTACSMVDPVGTDQLSLSHEQILRIADTNEFTHLDPAKAVDNGSFILLNNVQEGLMRIKDKQPVKGIAEEVKVSPDHLTYTFRLRKDAKWSDGVPITAYDFEYGWKRILDPELKSSYSFILYPIKGAEAYHEGKGSEEQVGVTAIDEKTLEVKLKEPMLNFLSLTTLPAYLPQRKDLVKKYGDQYATTLQHVAYSGPFVVKEWTRAKVVLVKNDKYWDRNSVSLQRVDIRLVKNIDSAVQLYQSNQVDIAPISREYIDSFKQSEDLKRAERATSYYLVMNQKDHFLKNPNVRKAISLSIDRLQITSQILKDGSTPAEALVHPAITGLGNKSFRDVTRKKWVTYNPDEAKAYLEKGLMELKMKKPPEKIRLLSYDDDKREVAVAVKQQLRKVLGLNVQVESVSSEEKLKRQEEGKFDIAVSSWGADYNDPIAYLELWSSNGKLNIANFESKEYDTLLRRAHKEADPEKKIQYLSQAEKILVQDEAVIVPIFYRVSSYLQKPYVRDFYNHAIGADYSLKWVYLRAEKK